MACAGPGRSLLATRLAATGLPSSHEIAGVPFFSQTRHHCGPAALAAILVFSGLDTDPDALSPMVYLPGRRGTLAAEMAAASRRLGRMPYPLDGTVESLVTEVAGDRPVAILLNLGLAALPRWHYAVVVGYNASREEFLLRSGTEKEKTMTAAGFMRAWKGSGFWAMVAVAPGEVPATVSEMTYVREAAALESAGMTREAETAWRRAVLLWPENPIPHLGLGNSLASLGRLSEAEEALRNHLVRAPDSVAGMNNLAHVLSLRGCHDEALLVIERALRQAAGMDLEKAVEATRAEIDDRSGKGGDCGK